MINDIDDELDEYGSSIEPEESDTSQSYPVTTVVSAVTSPVAAIENMDYFGKYVKKSRGCFICSGKNHMTINLMRARDHLPLSVISENTDISMDMLNLHFNNHFLISSNIQKILNIKENTNQESRELVRSILEGNIDLFAGAQGVLEAKGQRLHFIQQRIKELSDIQEMRILEDIEIQEFFQMNKLAEEVENSILKTWQIIDKKLFPISRDDLSNAILSYKLGVLSKLLDDIQIVFIEFEKDPRYTELVRTLRTALSARFNFLEDSILKSGGIIQAVEKVKAAPVPDQEEDHEED
jgi:hypothetical protein